MQETLCILSSRAPLATWQSKHFVGINFSGCMQVPGSGLQASLQVESKGDFNCLVLQSSSSNMVQTNCPSVKNFLG